MLNNSSHFNYAPERRRTVCTYPGRVKAAGVFLSPPSDPVAKRIAGVIARQRTGDDSPRRRSDGLSLKDCSGGGAGGQITRKMAMENQSNV